MITVSKVAGDRPSQDGLCRGAERREGTWGARTDDVHATDANAGLLLSTTVSIVQKENVKVGDAFCRQ
jgi:hypothetical protein